MATEETSPEEIATRMATVLSTVVNMAAALRDELALRARDPVELRSTLLWIADEMGWVASVVARGSTAGMSWPSDSRERIDRLRATAGAWDPVSPPSAEVLDAARRCLAILQPGAA